MTRRPGYVVPLLLLAIGFILLFREMGLLQWGAWGSLWRYWPVLLILWGLEILARHTESDVMYFIIMFLSIILIIGTVFLAWNGYPPQDKMEKNQWETIDKSNLEGKDFNFANLENANFSNSSLNGINMNFADLRYAKLDNTGMKGANLNFADLKYSNLQNANLDGANLNFANLDGANLTGASLEGANLAFTGTSSSTICPNSNRGPCW
jgi:hypothetical protein